MKPCFSNFIIFLVVFLPFLLLGHQNCSEIQEYEIENTGTLKQTNSAHPPIRLENLKLIRYNKDICDKEGLESFNTPVFFFNSETHICALASDMCETIHLENSGFEIASSKDCDNSIPIEEINKDSVEIQTAANYGYEPLSQTFCTQSIEPLVNLKSRVCIEATDGCQSQYLKARGFIKDNFEICFY